MNIIFKTYNQITKEKKNKINPQKITQKCRKRKKSYKSGCILKRVDQLPELYSELCQTSKIEVFANIINNL